MDSDSSTPSARLPAKAEALLPHQGRMCCIDALTACREDGARASAALRPGHALVDAAGRMEPFGFVELAAQTAGAMHGFLAGENRPELAMLVGVQKFSAPGTAVAGDVLRISVSVLGGLEDMLSLGFAVGKDGPESAPLAEGRLSVFIPQANDRRLGGMARQAVPESTAADGEADVPQNLPDSLGRYVVEAPRVVEETAGKKIIEAAFAFTPGFPGFDGHFPGNPIVPGIVQLMAAARAASRGDRSSVVSVSRCKFLRPVVPGEKIRALADVEEKEGMLHCRARLSVGDAPCAEAGFVLRPSPC